MSAGPVVGDSGDRARALIDLGRMDEAAELIARMVADEPENPALAAWFSLCLLHGDPERAEHEAARAVGLDPASPLAYEALARARLHLHDLDGAYGAASTLVTLEPFDPRAHILLAHCAVSHRRVAAHAADTAVELAPDDPAAWTVRARVLVARHRLKAAEHDVRHALELDPEYPPALELLSIVLAGRGRVEESIDAAEGLALVEPTRPEAPNAARFAAASAGGSGAILGIAAGRVVVELTSDDLGRPTAWLIGAAVMVGFVAVGTSVSRRVAARGDPRIAARRLRRWTRTTTVGLFVTIALLLAGVYALSRWGLIGPSTAEEAVLRQVDDPTNLEQVAFGAEQNPWVLFAYEREDDLRPCVAFAAEVERRWTVTEATCASPDVAATQSRSLSTATGRASIGVAAPGVVDLVSAGDGVDVHGMNHQVDGSNRRRFVVFFANRGEAAPMFAVSDGGSTSPVRIHS